MVKTAMQDGRIVSAIVCPKQKLVKILVGHYGKRTSLAKTYRFKETVPQIQKTISVTKYDFKSWAVSEQQYEQEKVITVYDEKIIESIRERAIQHYINSITQK